MRNIVANFTFFKEREMVRKLWKELDGSVCRAFEQFPQEVIEKRRKLVPQMKEARRLGKRAFLAYDTLYINGSAVRSSTELTNILSSFDIWFFVWNMDQAI